MTHKEVMRAAGVSREVEKIAENFKKILSVLPDAQAREKKERVVRTWLDKVKDISYDMDDAFDEYITSFLRLQNVGVENSLVNKKVCFFLLAPHFFFRAVALCRQSAVMIKKINENLDDLIKEMAKLNLKESQSTEKQIQISPPVGVNEIHGRNEKKNILVSKLLSESSQQESLRIISIIGMGGSEKTTLSQFAYNDDAVKKHFDIRIWVCVSDSFDEFKIAKAIIEAIKGFPSNQRDIEYLLPEISMSIITKKFLLVLEDVWIEDYNKWKPFHYCLGNGLYGSKILITTQKELIANMMRSNDIININELSDEENWSLFKELAFRERTPEECEKLEICGKEIVKRCKGLPLAIKTMGSLLCSKRTIEEWEYILDNEIWKLEEFEKDSRPAFLLSYNDLPSMIRLCFSYCAIFPKDYKIEKNTLIKLWMAQGYLGLEQNIEMEIVGERYFNHLVRRFFFQEIKVDNSNIVYCKVHDILHDLAQILRENECLTVEVNDVDDREKIFHSVLTLKKNVPFPTSIFKFKKLRSLLISFSYKDYDCSLPCEVLSQLFDELTCLRVLDINGEFEQVNFIEEIPKNIGKLIHLRYLDLSNRKIEKLPETFCELYNLQTLKLIACYELKELPQGIGKLLNLRHLLNDETDSLSKMPIGIVKLTCLRTLSEFIVSGGSGSNDDSRACRLEYLNDLSNLRGELTIRGLGNVRDVGKTKRIQVLKNKRNVLRLVLRFDEHEEGERKDEDDKNLLLEALQPPPNLEKLRMDSYRGINFPYNWIMQLTKLTELRLYFCDNCKHLSPLEKLPSLKSLYIKGMESVKRVDDAFWEIVTDATSSSVIFFPQLKYLEFSDMEEWEEWDYRISQKDIIIMPSLSSLTINFCDKLKALPDSLVHSTTLTELKIFCCDSLKQRYKPGRGKDWLKISHIPNIQIDYDV